MIKFTSKWDFKAKKEELDISEVISKHIRNSSDRSGQIEETVANVEVLNSLVCILVRYMPKEAQRELGNSLGFEEVTP